MTFSSFQGLNDVNTFATDALDHQLGPYFEALSGFSSTAALWASPLYARLRPEIDRVLGGVAQEAPARDAFPARPSIRATAWNIERGRRVDNVIRALREHPLIRESDVLLLTELDYGMARSGNRNVPREIARALGLHYAFAPCYVNLSKGSGLEDRAASDNAQALHGNAVFSRHPLRDAHAIPLPNGKDKMRGKEKRLGSQRAVVATVDHPLGAVRVVSVHLDAHSTQRHRRRQMEKVLDHLDGLRPALPALIGGDWNTSTYTSRRALYAIVGFWRRVFMGVG
jgi:endonuclease/exonuclease/phosphatase family metal-dependent hydrolase